MFLRVDLIIHFLWLTGGLALLYFGAEWLVRGASCLALRLGISPLVVGLTVVAFGTSMPELLVCLKANSPDIMSLPAVWCGFQVDYVAASPDIAFGNIVGSNIFNIALILGVSAMIHPIVINAQLIRREMPILIVSSGVFLVMMMDMNLSRWEGGVLVLGILIYLMMSFRMSQKESGLGQRSEMEEEVMEEAKKGGGSPLVNILLITVGIGALVLGAGWLVNHGEAIARVFGVPEVIISLTLFALGTSLPELATSVVAALKKEGDIITGNAIGSCIFNLLAVMGVTAAVNPLRASNVSWVDLGVMMGLTVLILPFMWSRMKISRVEGVILTGIAISYSVMVIVVQR